MQPVIGELEKLEGLSPSDIMSMSKCFRRSMSDEQRRGLRFSEYVPGILDLSEAFPVGNQHSYHENIDFTFW